MNKQSEYLTIQEAAKLLGVTSTTLRNWDKSGKLVAERHPINGYRLYALDRMMELVREQGTVYQTRMPTVTPSVIQPTLFPISPTPPQLDIRAFRLLIRQMSSAFRDSMGGGLLERFEEISKLLYCKLYDERKSLSSNHNTPSFFRIPGESFEETYQRITLLYRQAIEKLPDVFTNGHRELSDDKKAIVTVVELLQDIQLYNLSEDTKGVVYEELIRNTFDKSDNQQFFTPRQVVHFMVEFMKPHPDQVICDPACGSGGFLIETASYMRKHRENNSQLIGLEIDRRMAWTAQMNLLMHGDGRGTIYHLRDGGSLAFSDHLNEIVPPNSIDLILTNPPFGSDFSDQTSLSQYDLGKNKTSRRRGALFIERCLNWLKPGGRLGIVIDDSILNGKTNTDVRQLILHQSIIEAVVSLPDVTFMPYATAKASILFLHKKQDVNETQPPIFMAHAEHVGRKSNGDPLYAEHRDDNGQPEMQDELPFILKNWINYLAHGEQALTHLAPKIFICSPDQFKNTEQGIRLDVPFHHPSRKIAEEILNRSIYPTPKLSELVITRNITAIPAKQDPDEIWNYVGLANIVPDKGEYTVSQMLGRQIKSNVRLYREGDILFSKLRPELRKCVLIRDDENEGFASSECLIFCTLESAIDDPDLGEEASKILPTVKWQIDKEYLAFLLRSDIIFGQIVYQITGVGRPRVNQSAILSLKIPLPPLSVQHEIVATYKMAWKHFINCRERSKMILEEGEETLKTAEAHIRENLCPNKN